MCCIHKTFGRKGVASIRRTPSSTMLPIVSARQRRRVPRWVRQPSSSRNGSASSNGSDFQQSLRVLRWCRLQHLRLLRRLHLRDGAASRNSSTTPCFRVRTHEIQTTD